MRFIIMHATSAHWESGAICGPELIARVVALFDDMTKAGALQGAEGLRPTSEGVRLRFAGGRRTIVGGPFTGEHELPAGFSVLRTRSIDEAIEWAAHEADLLGPQQILEIDIRPVVEPWDLGLAPKPAGLDTRRYMVLRKATAATEAGATPSAGLRAKLAERAGPGAHLLTETMRPSARGRRYVNSRDGVSMFDGPFVETKELLAGYVIVSAESLDQAGRWAARYIEAVEATEVEVRELEL
jgi:hypothetical protein